MELLADAEYEGLSISGESYTGGDLGSASFRRCQFDQVRFSGTVFAQASFEHCRFTGCDLSNADLSEAGLDTVTVNDSKLLGATFAGAVLRSVQVTETLCRLVSFFRASVSDTSFIECDLGEADFREAKLRLAALARCDLSAVSFTGADARQLDIRGSTLDGSVSLSECRGFVISTPQLAPLAARVLREIGATVDDDDLAMDPMDLPGGLEVARLEPVDPVATQRGLKQARSQLLTGGRSASDKPERSQLTT